MALSLQRLSMPVISRNIPLSTRHPLGQLILLEIAGAWCIAELVPPDWLLTLLRWIEAGRLSAQPVVGRLGACSFRQCNRPLASPATSRGRVGCGIQGVGSEREIDCVAIGLTCFIAHFHLPKKPPDGSNKPILVIAGATLALHVVPVVALEAISES